MGLWKEVLMEYKVKINGIDVTATFSKEDIDGIYVPLLKKLASIRRKKGSRVIMMLAAPPGAGKSTLASFLAHLAKEVLPENKVQAIGMDGFHLRQEYLLSHTANVGGREVSMVDIKGAPITFDLEKLTAKVKEVAEGGICSWPGYDRLGHNPYDDAVQVTADIVILEGNYLLLDMDGWRGLRKYADYTAFIYRGEELLRDRLISRKMASGKSELAAEKFVDFSDMANVKLVLEKSTPADLNL